ncbi:MAG TPA: acetylxylan esterase, partial [Acidobacteriaceae bacterium]
DHQRLLDLLHITALRPGVSPNPQSPNPVNYDESKANPWPSLPSPLILDNGKPVNSAKVWWTQRRPQIVELFDREVYGRVPANVPAVHWQVVSTTPGTEAGIATITRRLIGHVDNSAYPVVTVDIEASLTVPANSHKPVPVILEFTFENYPHPANRPAASAPTEWKQQVLAKGWGYALLYPTTIQADNGAGLTQGIIGLSNHGHPRRLDDWGVLRAWAWGGSRLMDYLETDKDVDARHVAVSGHSRFGKTALVAMAYDQRFAAAYVNSSGAGGANLARRHYGEQLENIAATGEYHWMAGNYLKYAELAPKEVTPADLPVDSHELIALCAPRPVFIGGGTTEGGDAWADVRGTFIAEVAAGAVYKLLGARGLMDENGITSTFPPVGAALITGDLGFRQHSGGHTPAPDYPIFLDFATRYMTPLATAATRGVAAGFSPR